MELVYKGSVKDIYKKNSHLVFEYSNRYSIFDWGEMPDEIPFKGEALASMAGSFFEYLNKKNIPSHYLGTLDRNSIEVKGVDVLRPKWSDGHYDYTIYHSRPVNCLVPLEIIFRKYLSQGNSLEVRLKNNPSYLQDLQLSEGPTINTRFTPALIEFSTKLESTDRYLSRREIDEMNILTNQELYNLRSQTQQVAQELENLFSSFGVRLWDGKLEFAFAEKNNSGERSLLLVDSIGPDELRLTYEGLPLSKEFLRQIYAPSSWNQAVKKAKELAKQRQTNDWKSICREELKETPRPLSKQQVEVSSLLYQSLANEIAEKVDRKKPFSEIYTISYWHEKAQKVLQESL